MSPAVRQAAMISTARACGFGALAVMTAMIGFVGTPVLSLKLGGLLFLLVTTVLILKAWRAPWMPYQRTEVWLLLAEADRPSSSIAQTVISSARIEAFYRFAHISATIAALFLAGGILAGLLSPN